MDAAAKGRQGHFSRIPQGFRRKAPLNRQTFARDGAHNLAKTIQFPKRRVHVWRNPQPGEFLVNNRGSEDSVLIEEIAANLSLVEALDLDVRDRAHLLWIERCIEADLRNVFKLVHPVSRQVSQARFLALPADAVVKQNRLANGQSGRG